MCVFHLNFSRLDVTLRAQELGTDKCKLNAKCLTAHLTNCACHRCLHFRVTNISSEFLRVLNLSKNRRATWIAFFSSKLGLPDSNPGGCTDDWRMPGPDILNRLARKSLKSFIRQFQGLPLGIQGLTSDAERAWFRRAVNCSLVSSRTGLTNHPSHLICKYTALHPLKAVSKTPGSKPTHLSCTGFSMRFPSRHSRSSLLFWKGPSK